MTTETTFSQTWRSLLAILLLALAGIAMRLWAAGAAFRRMFE